MSMSVSDQLKFFSDSTKTEMMNRENPRLCPSSKKTQMKENFFREIGIRKIVVAPVYGFKIKERIQRDLQLNLIKVLVTRS